MLKELRLKNIVLIEFTTLLFSHDFNILSGESGSGKSAILNALNLISGERTDASCVRHGEEKGIVEAVFDISKLPIVLKLLEDAGIDHDSDSELFIRREVTAIGKSRTFINNQLAQLGLLKQVSSYLFEVVGQHANQKLLSLDYQRQVLDLYGNNEEDANSFSQSWQEETKTRETLNNLIQSESQRIREIEICRVEIEEIKQAYLQENEEEDLFAEYTKLSNADELVQKIEEILTVMTGDKIGALNYLNRQKSNFEKLIKLAPALNDSSISFENACLELMEITHTLRNFLSSIENHPEKIAFLDTRLQLITKMKRKYGSSIEEINRYCTLSEKKLNSLEDADADIESLQNKLALLSNQTTTLALCLTNKRKTAASLLEGAIVEQLRSLNMPKVEFFIEITPQKRSKHGDDKIDFYLIPNIGEHKVLLKECASGGELSRIMLAIQALLGSKEQIPTLIFDEIDANIGGETAVVVGEKLKEIAKEHQVLCITHFPQVARLAKHHLKIFKKEINGRTITQVDTLDHASHLKELMRMQGG